MRKNEIKKERKMKERMKVKGNEKDRKRSQEDE